MRERAGDMGRHARDMRQHAGDARRRPGGATQPTGDTRRRPGDTTQHARDRRQQPVMELPHPCGEAYAVTATAGVCSRSRDVRTGQSDITNHQVARCGGSLEVAGAMGCLTLVGPRPVIRREPRR
jgi:hypothetical protein